MIAANDEWSSLSYLDRALSDDPVLSAVAGLFALPASGQALTEPGQSALAVKRARRRYAHRMLPSPGLISVLAATILIACALTGIVLGNPAIAMSGIAAALFFGILCHFAIRQSRRASAHGDHPALR